MAEVLTHEDFHELRQQYSGKHQVFHQTEGFDYIEQREDPFSKEHYRAIQFRPELRFEIIDDLYYSDLSLRVDHDDYHRLVSKFYLSGYHNVLTPNTPGIPESYGEQGGYHYLFYLPDIDETEQFFAQQHLHLVRIEIDPHLLQSYIAGCDLPVALRSVIQGNLRHRFHQTVGRMTAAMQLTLQQLLHCPYQGTIQRIYLESKVLELIALQVSQWAEQNPASLPVSANALLPSDLERLHQAKEILLQNWISPPSLLELSRQVGLNDYKLKQGFRQVFGTTVFGYLQIHRMAQAQRLLTESDYSVAYVAQRIGYTSQSRFCDAFKRQFGLSPRAYRMQLKTGRSVSGK